jgi:hypothetical protein
MAAILLQSVGQNAAPAITVIPLLILYLGIIAWLSYDASQDSNWVVWLLLFLFAGPVTIPFYIFASLLARRGTSQDKLDQLADEKRGAANAFKFSSDIDKLKWAASLDPAKGTVFEPSLGLSLRQDRHDAFIDDRANWLLETGDDAEAFDYLTGMYAIASEQADGPRIAGYKRIIETRLTNGAARFAYWQQHGTDIPEPDEIEENPEKT